MRRGFLCRRYPGWRGFTRSRILGRVNCFLRRNLRQWLSGEQSAEVIVFQIQFSRCGIRQQQLPNLLQPFIIQCPIAAVLQGVSNQSLDITRIVFHDVPNRCSMQLASDALSLKNSCFKALTDRPVCSARSASFSDCA